jgi:hypothetical protein
LPGGEDQDELGVLIEQPHEVLGLDERGCASLLERTQPEGSPSGPGDTDRTLHSLRRFVRLAASGNPSILMALWAPVIFSTPEGDERQGLADAFVGRHVIPRYRGYMQSQAERLLGTRSRSGQGHRAGGGREELLAAHGYDTKYSMHSARLGFQCLELLANGRLTLPIACQAGDCYVTYGAGMWPSTSGGSASSVSIPSWRPSSATSQFPSDATAPRSTPGWRRRTSASGEGETLKVHRRLELRGRSTHCLIEKLTP